MVQRGERIMIVKSLKGGRKEEERGKKEREKRKTVQWLEMKKQKKGCPRKDIP